MKPQHRDLVGYLNTLRKDGRKALSLFVTAGFPTIDQTVPLVLELVRSGADLIELGIPFSDPIVDGPTIQLSSEIALRNGASLKTTFEMAEQIRQRTDVPLVLMGYANPIFRYGLKKFVDECHQVGIDGTIIPDLPLEESDDYRKLAQQHDVTTIFLAAPTTSNGRLSEIDRCSTGFVYCVSITGVTGERREISKQAVEFLTRARRYITRNPLLVGFGIATPSDACEIARLSDGVIVGSALINTIQQAPRGKESECATAFVRSIREALHEI
jgi:tryptophan synthase alpha chain